MRIFIALLASALSAVAQYDFKLTFQGIECPMSHLAWHVFQQNAGEATLHKPNGADVDISGTNWTKPWIFQQETNGIGAAGGCQCEVS